MGKEKTDPAARKVRVDDLSMFADGLYIELDKLSKKDPYAAISELATRRVNRAIEDAKALLGAGDRYLEGIEVLDPGADTEARDAVLILQEIRKAIERAEAAERRRVYGQ